MSKSQKEDCVELQHDSQRIFEGRPIPLIQPQMIQQMINSMGMPSMMKNFVTRMMPTISIYPSKLSIDDLPKTQCVFIPHAPNANIIRVIGHYHGEHKANPQLIISSDPIKCNEQQRCSDVCSNKTEQECLCVNADEPITAFDQMNGKENGFDATVIWVTPHIDGGKKYITTCHGDIGFQVFSMFTHVINHGNPSKRRINDLKIAPPKSANSDLMYVGGTSIKNVLIHHLNDNVNSYIPNAPKHDHEMYGLPPPPQHKVNLVVQLNKDDTKDIESEIEMTVLPLIHETGLQQQYIQHCIINEDNPEQCSVYIRGAFDYDIRFENHGGSMSDINIFTMEIPTNNINDNVQAPLDYHQEEEYPLVDSNIPQQSGRPIPIFNIAVVIAIIVISIIGLLSILRIRRKRRKVIQKAYVDVNGDITEDTVDQIGQTPFVAMNDEVPLSYQVFSVPSH